MLHPILHYTIIPLFQQSFCILIAMCYTDFGDCMRKVYFMCFILCFFLCVGCTHKEKSSIKSVDLEEVKHDTEEVSTYQDLNQTPISFYKLEGNTLKKISSISGDFEGMDDVLFVQIYPSDEEEITLTGDFATDYYQQWMSYYEKNPIHLGFSLEFSLNNGESIFYNIYNPSDAMSHWEYFMAYLYDDYINRGRSFYSHIEENEFTSSSFITAFKLQCGPSCFDISSVVSLNVFTYDDDLDFLDDHYRGNSQSSLSICLRKSICS
mgnify:CR=1 FL=1